MIGPSLAPSVSRALQDAKAVAKEIARLPDPSASDTFMRACHLLKLHEQPERDRAAVAVALMTNAMSLGEYVAKLKPTVGRTATARQRPTARATNELKDFAR